MAYEALENGGISLEIISGTRTDVAIGNRFSDYTATRKRDPEDRAGSITIGLPPSILSNRLGLFFSKSVARVYLSIRHALEVWFH